MVSKHHFPRWARCSFLHQLDFLDCNLSSKINIQYPHLEISTSLQAFCMLYTLIGIPLTLVLLSSFVDRLMMPVTNTKTQKHKNTNTHSFSSPPSLIAPWCRYGDKHKPSPRNLEYRTYKYVNNMILIIMKNKVIPHKFRISNIYLC